MIKWAQNAKRVGKIVTRKQSYKRDLTCAN